MLDLKLVSIFFGTSIPTSFNILVKIVLHFTYLILQELFYVRPPVTYTVCSHIYSGELRIPYGNSCVDLQAKKARAENTLGIIESAFCAIY